MKSAEAEESRVQSCFPNLAKDHLATMRLDYCDNHVNDCAIILFLRDIIDFSDKLFLRLSIDNFSFV